jgi:hypothetical protein
MLRAFKEKTASMQDDECKNWLMGKINDSSSFIKMKRKLTEEEFKLIIDNLFQA